VCIPSMSLALLRVMMPIGIPCHSVYVFVGFPGVERTAAQWKVGSATPPVEGGIVLAFSK
jgi:hypothetical protein